MSEAIQKVTDPEVPEGDDPDPDTDAEYRALYADAQEGTERLAMLAKSAKDSGHPEIAKIYDEVRGTVMSILSDVITATGGALTNIEDQVAAQGEGESQLLPDDAEKYLQLFGQYRELIDGLRKLVPSGSSDGDKQHAVFDTLIRMTDGMEEFTKSITLDDDDDDDDDPSATVEEDPEE